MKVWVALSGYRDQSIIGVFSSQALARSAISAVWHPHETYEVEEWDVDEFADRLNAGLKPFRARMDVDGQKPIASRNYFLVSEDDDRITMSRKLNYVAGTVWATDEDRALSVLDARRLQLLAVESES